MSAVTVSEIEGRPEQEADATAWARIESWIDWRWVSRPVTYIVEGGGDWCPRLKPVTFSATEVWSEYDWTPITLKPSPLGGYVLPGIGPYRFTGTVGDGSAPPPEVVDAATKLSAYLAENNNHPGSSRYADDVGRLSVTVDRAPTWVARALQHSGAADLLRPYRSAR